MREQAHEKVENYDGWIDALYDGIRKGINKIPNRYAKNFVRGLVTTPFVIVGMIAEEYIMHPKHTYSLSNKLISDMETEINKGDSRHLMSGVVYLLGAYSSVIGLGAAAVYNPSVFFTIMSAGTGLDAANYVEHKIRKKP